jgi:hypothetical protein
VETLRKYLKKAKNPEDMADMMASSGDESIASATVATDSVAVTRTMIISESVDSCQWLVDGGSASEESRSRMLSTNHYPLVSDQGLAVSAQGIRVQKGVKNNTAKHGGSVAASMK